MALDNDIKKIESELSERNLSSLLSTSNQINILDIGISKVDKNKVDLVKEYLLDITGKEININVLNYNKFIENILGMSFEKYSNEIKNRLKDDRMDFSKAIEYTENLLKEKNNLSQGNFWINYSISQMLLLANREIETTPNASLENIYPVSILHPIIAKKAQEENKQGVSLIELTDFKNILNFQGSTELKKNTKNLFLKEQLSDIDAKNYRTALDFLTDQLSSIRHAVGASQNKQFIEHLIKEYDKETQQSLFPVKFGFVSNRLTPSNGRLEVISPEEIDTKDLSQYGAIFIDNDYNFARVLEPLKKANNTGEYFSKLGMGLEDLEKITSMKKKPSIIFYQTAHDLERISDEDKEKVESLAGAILLPKNVAPKFSFEENMAQKEIEISRLLSQYKELFQYTSQTLQINDSKPFVREVAGEKYFITLSKSALVQKINEEKKIETLKENNLENNILNNKMYILSMFHEALKSETNKEVFQEKNVDFFEYDDIKSKILPSLTDGLEEYEKTYNEIVDKHRKHDPTTISHNDTKWDNWFGKVLGDYGQASIGTEYKDIARSLLERETLENNKIITKKTIDKTIDSYIALRKNNSEDFNVNINEFRQNVYEMVFVESLRLARYESIQNSEKLTNGLLTNARYTHNLITDNFKQHGALVSTIEQIKEKDKDLDSKYEAFLEIFDHKGFQEFKKEMLEIGKLINNHQPIKTAQEDKVYN